MVLLVRRFDDVEAFLAATGAFLAEREAEHNLIFGICSWLRHSAELVEEAPTLMAVTDASHDVA